MNAINVYLTFDGNCAEAMKFYQSTLKGSLEMMPFSQMKDMKVPAGSENRIMHARMGVGQATLMASDTMPGYAFAKGNNFSVSLNCESTNEVDEFMNGLKQGGTVTMPAQNTFWGAYFGMLTDRYGVQWMFNYDQPKN